MTAPEIWIYGDLRSTRHWRNCLKVLVKAQPVAQETDALLAMVLIGAAEPAGGAKAAAAGAACISLDEAARQAGACGAERIYALVHPALAVPRTDAYAAALADWVRQRSPWLILLPLSDFGRETAAICAQRCGAGLIADCAELALRDGRIVGRCPAWGGQILADITLAEGWRMALVTVQPQGAALPAELNGSAQIEKITPANVATAAGMRLIQRDLQAHDARCLEEAAMVVVGGAGLGNLDGFGLARELAAALGAEIGATRPPVMQHWVEEERLIGQTGKCVRPQLLISVGTSGAIQYTAGIREAKTVVAINRDPAAPIFQWADIGIVTDARIFLPLLTERVKQVVMRQLADASCSLTAKEGGLQGGFGDLVRRLREARDWSADELAQRTGQTPDFIAQVEADELSPPVAFILRMAQAMQVDPGTFLNKEEQAAIRDRRAQAYYRRTQEYSYTTLTPEAQNSHLRAFMVTIEPHHAHKPVAYKHEGEEFIFVMEGDLEFTLGSAARVLKPGESIHFNSDVPHKLRSLSNEPTRCLVVLYTI